MQESGGRVIRWVVSLVLRREAPVKHYDRVVESVRGSSSANVSSIPLLLLCPQK
jgi:hypothetical protein